MDTYQLAFGRAEEAERGLAFLLPPLIFMCSSRSGVSRAMGVGALLLIESRPRPGGKLGAFDVVEFASPPKFPPAFRSRPHKQRARKHGSKSICVGTKAERTDCSVFPF